MGAWGTGLFENDAALDWLRDLTEASAPLEVLEASLAPLVEDFLDADDGAALLAAAEVIAALAGRGAPDLPETLAGWLGTHRALDVSPLLPLAAGALDSVLSERSELYLLWRDAGEMFDAWHAGVLDMKTRLQCAPSTDGPAR